MSARGFWHKRRRTGKKIFPFFQRVGYNYQQQPYIDGLDIKLPVRMTFALRNLSEDEAPRRIAMMFPLNFIMWNNAVGGLNKEFQQYPLRDVSTNIYETLNSTPESAAAGMVFILQRPNTPGWVDALDGFTEIVTRGVKVKFSVKNVLFDDPITQIQRWAILADTAFGSDNLSQYGGALNVSGAKPWYTLTNDGGESLTSNDWRNVKHARWFTLNPGNERRDWTSVSTYLDAAKFYSRTKEQWRTHDDDTKQTITRDDNSEITAITLPTDRAVFQIAGEAVCNFNGTQSESLEDRMFMLDLTYYCRVRVRETASNIFENSN